MKLCPRCQLRYPSHATSCFVDGAELAPIQDPRIGTILDGRYEIQDVIAEGGMATVYLARHQLANRSCAVKIMSPTLIRNKIIRERFRREAKATQKLAHPNIIEILDHGETEDRTPYIVMELLTGETLADAVALGPMPVSLVLPIAVQVTRALARAHDFAVIHRDLKPENVFLCASVSTTPQVKLLDFGIARSLHDARLTNLGEVFGTPQYMAPERITSIDAGASADLYALGVILFEMLAGHQPFQADNVSTLFAMHMKAPVPPLRAERPDIPPELEALVQSLMAKQVEQRPVDAHRVLADLVSLCDQLKLPLPPEPQPPEPTAAPQHKSLPPTSPDRWALRTHLFEKMLGHVAGADASAQARRKLQVIQNLVAELGHLRADATQMQKQLATHEARAREARQRFGFAMDALGVDASRARDSAREAHQQAKQLAEVTLAHALQMRALHGELLLWEGRCAFAEPYPQLAQTYRNAANLVDHWYAARLKDVQQAQRAAELDRDVADLDYQIAELRSALSRLEQSTEEERSALETRTAELGKQADALEQQLLALASEFCEPLRSTASLAPLFEQLE